jgi:hypothetical protein
VGKPAGQSFHAALALIFSMDHASRDEEFEDYMGEERKIVFDQSLPGEFVLIVSFALFLVLVFGLLLG